MKIGLTIRTFYPKSGGLQAHTEKLVHALRHQGHDVTLLTWTISRTPTYHDVFFYSESHARAEINGLQVYLLRHPRIANLMTWVASKCIVRPRLQTLGILLFKALFIRQAIAAFKGVDIVHHVGQSHELIGFVAAAVARQLKVPFIIQPTVHPFQWGDSSFDFYLYRQADCIFALTQFEQRFLQSHGLANPRFCIVGNGIDDRTDGNGDRFRNTHQIEGDIILFLGRKSSDKGYFLLKQAFALVREVRSDVTLVCMGPTPSDAPTLPSQTGVLELDFGSEQAKHDALAACTTLCVPSEGEAFGLVYMEAGRYAKPVIGRRVPVLQELLGQYNAAVLVGNVYGEGNQVSLEPQELRDALFQVLNDPKLAQELGHNAYRVSAEFIWPQIVTRFETAYSKAVNDFADNGEYS